MTIKDIPPEILSSESFDAARVLIRKIAHDYNNLLTPLVAYPQIIGIDLPEGSDGKNMLAAMEKAAKDIMRINKQLLDLSSSDEGDPQDVSILGMLDEAVEGLGEDVIPDNIAIEVEVSEDLDTVYCYEESAIMAIQSICMNSIDAMPDGGKLSLKAENVVLEQCLSDCGLEMKSGRYVEIKITDTGMGIPEEMKETIFVPFVTTKKKMSVRGVGLGLSIVYRVMSDSNGCVNFESVPGEGSSFSLFFPA